MIYIRVRDVSVVFKVDEGFGGLATRDYGGQVVLSFKVCSWGVYVFVERGC